jgi:two-component system, probable response regulator PhcQ
MIAKILIVDDDPAVPAALRRALHKQPYEVLSATSAREALRMLGATPVDVVISDEEMPGMQGTGLLNKVRELCPDTIRFILTGKATLSVALQAINAGGVSRFLLKPCNAAELIVAIRQELEKRDLMAAARQLLKKVKHQSAMLHDLEAEYPRITDVHRDSDGAIWLDDISGDVASLLAEIYREIEMKPMDI